MKIYNKKGLILGALWTILGLCGLLAGILSPDIFLPEQIKDIVISVAVILIGTGGFFRAFSKEATAADQIEERDERNALLKLRTKSLTLKILYGCLACVTIGGVGAYKLTTNTAWISAFTVAGVLLGFLLLVEMIVGFYYEKHM